METPEIEPNPNNHRKFPPKSRKKPIPKKKLAIINQKITFLSQNFKPLPFVPNAQTMTVISTHESLFRSLNLWDFANLNLDSQIRTPLLIELIAYYDPTKHHSSVRGLRIKLSRADLAHALKLPLKNHKLGAVEFNAKEFGGGDEIASVIWGSILNKMVFLDDTGILPDEIVNANRLVKEGLPNKVDWAGLVWNLVEKEISETVPENGKCRYASHLQCLMKSQKPKLFEEVCDLEVEALEPTTTIEEECGGVGSEEKCEPGLSLGVGEGCKEGKKGEEEECGLNCNAGTSQCENLIKEEMYKSGRVEDDELSRGKNMCKRVDDELVAAKLFSSECEDLSKEEQDMVERVKGHKMSKVDEEDGGKRVDDGFNNELAEAKFPTLDRLTSSDFMQVMGSNNNLTFGLDDQSNGEFLAMGTDVHNKSMGLELGPGDSFFFGNEHKRASDEIVDDVKSFHQNNQQKRFRSDQTWEHSPAILSFDGLREQIQHVMGKARMDLVEREQDYINAQEQIRYLNEVLQQKDAIIQSLENSRMEELQKRQNEACRFEHDLRTLSNTLFGCKKALKDTQIAFTEYRNKFPIVDKHLCREGEEIGRDVLDGELREQSLKEEEMRELLKSMIKDFGSSWFEKLHKHATSVSKSVTKLVNLWGELKLLKERLAKAKNQQG